MIIGMTGKLISLTDVAAILQIEALEYEVYVPEFVRRQLQNSLDEQVHLKTMDYLEGNPQKGRLTPRLIGFTSEPERQFFEAICSVDGVGIKKALKAIVRPVCEVAAAIEEQNVKELSTLPGIGPAVAERIVAKLRRKMAKFALLVQRETGESGGLETDVFKETYEALLALGHTSGDARQKLDAVLEKGKKCKSVEDLLQLIYQQEFH